VAFGSRTTRRAHAAKAFSWSVSPVSLPLRTAAARAGSEAADNFPPHANEQ
jgi:hypothetical protein